MSSSTRQMIVCCAALATLAASACGSSGSEGAPAAGSGGASSSGSGGKATTGGASGGLGTGGTPTIGSGGDTPATGGSIAAGGSGAGGSPTTGGATATGGGATGGASASGGSQAPSVGKFSFFLTSVGALQKLAGNEQGFGGDLRFGETGDGAGIRGADKICTTIAESALPGAGAKVWRAFLSAPTGGPGGGAVHAIDRIGEGPWYDRMGRLFSAKKANLVGMRPTDADPTIINDFPNETGIPNHQDGAPGCSNNACPDNHDTLTGSDANGQLYTGGTNPTCSGWTTAEGAAGRPRVGHSWPRTDRPGGGVFGGGIAGGMGGGMIGGGAFSLGHWMSALDEAGCAAGASLVEMGPPQLTNPTVGSGGGYGGFYCFALTP